MRRALAFAQADADTQPTFREDALSLFPQVRSERETMEIKTGIPVSPGVAIGTVYLLDSEEVRIVRHFIRKDEVQSELERWEQCREIAKSGIVNVRDQVRNVVQDEVSLIFDTHLRIIDDPAINAEIRDRIKADRYSPEYAVSRSFRKVINAIRELDDSYFGQRISDFVDIERRLMRALSGKQADGLGKLNEVPEGGVIVAHDLTPSQTAGLVRRDIMGFATELGGSTSHTAILANALGLPAVVGIGDLRSFVTGGETIVVDGSSGRVIISPDDATKEKYQRRSEDYRNRERRILESASALPSETADQAAFKLLANIEFEDEVSAAITAGAEGLGLYRTEFIFSRHQRPSEEHHFDALKRAISALGNRPLVVRTLDFGADKFREEAGLDFEENPFLGNRSIRLCLQQPEVFRRQLRAILRASVLGDLRIMLPMISSIEELRLARNEIEIVSEDLERAGLPFRKDVSVGIMIEVPSAALIAEDLAKEADFFSIGTNDLVQYTLAVDRNNPSVSHLYQNAHPAILQLIKRVVDAGGREGIPVSVCGEMAGDVEKAVLLLGLGIRRFSTNPNAIPVLKTALNRVTVEQAEGLARECMAMASVQEINRHLRAKMSSWLGEDFGY